MSTPRVSVIIAAWNAAKWIAETIDSVLAQTAGPVEIIVVDGGSTDDTAAIVAGYGERVRWFVQDRPGRSAARNIGISHATGEFIAFLDADDLWLPEKLAVQLARLDDDPSIGWVYSDVLYFEEGTERELGTAGAQIELPEGDVLEKLLLRNFIASPTPVIRREVMQATGGFCEVIPRLESEDWDMWLRVAERARAGVIRKPLARYRIHRASITATMNLHRSGEHRAQIVEWAVERNPRLAGIRKQALARVWNDVANWALVRGDRAGARALFANAVKYRPAEARNLAGWAATLLPMPLLRGVARVRKALRNG